MVSSEASNSFLSVGVNLVVDCLWKYNRMTNSFRGARRGTLLPLCVSEAPDGTYRIAYSHIDVKNWRRR